MKLAPGWTVRGLGGGTALILLLLASATAKELNEDRRKDAYLREHADPPPTRVVDMGPIPSEVRESSGLAVSRAYPGVFWTHNDSGDGPRLYALDETAQLIATVEVPDARARDWEALDVGPCPVGPTPWCLYVADTGDNARRRESVAVYIVPEPDPYGAPATVGLAGTVRFTYESGPFDVEALAVTPSAGLVLATKGRSPSMWVFDVPPDVVARASRSGETLTLGAAARLPIEPDFALGRWMTGGSLNADGTVLALRTYTEVYFYAWPLGPPGAEPATVAPNCVLGMLQPTGGEAIAFSADERIFLTSESLGDRAGHLLEIECQGIGGDGVRLN